MSGRGAHMSILTFGAGLYGVDAGTYRGKPAVFVIPSEIVGVVGDKIPLKLQLPLAYDEAPADWIVMVFPTIERCQEVADALVGVHADAFESAQLRYENERLREALQY